MSHHIHIVVRGHTPSSDDVTSRGTSKVGDWSEVGLKVTKTSTKTSTFQLKYFTKVLMAFLLFISVSSRMLYKYCVHYIS